MNARDRIARLGALLTLLALPLAVSPAIAARHDWDQSFTVAAHPTVRVRTGDARVRVHSGPVGAVRAVVHWESNHWGFTSPPREPNVRLEKVADAVEIEVREPVVFAFFGGVSDRVEVDVTVPASCDLQVHTGDGSIALDDPLSGNFDLSSGDGRVILHGTKGRIHVSGGDGEVAADSIDGDFYAHTGDGRVSVEGRLDLVDVRTGDGHVDVTARPGSQLASDWNLETHDSSLDLLIPRDLKAELDARTGDGRIRFDLPVTVGGRLDSHVIRGLLNGGGPMLRLRTGDGPLTLGVSN